MRPSEGAVKKKLRKTSIRFDDNPAMTVFRARHKLKRVVYVLLADKPQKYGKKRSRIIYIGESGKRGFERPATSAYRKADQAFGTKKSSEKLHGVGKIDVHLLTFRGKRNVRLWEELEKNLLAIFANKYKCLPRFNHKGKGSDVEDIRYFQRSRLDAIIERLAY